MTLNLTQRLALSLVIAAGTAASVPAHAAALGYGTFLGEFAGNPLPAAAVENALTPVPFTTLDLHYLGGTAPVPFFGWIDVGAPDFTVDVSNSNGRRIGGSWDYLGFPTLLAPWLTPLPAGDHVQMFLALKYSRGYAVFHYPDVTFGDSGLFSTSASASGALLSSAANGTPFALSYVQAYWADIAASPVPLPPALVLLLTGVAALFGLNRFRRAPPGRLVA